MLFFFAPYSVKNWDHVFVLRQSIHIHYASSFCISEAYTPFTYGLTFTHLKVKVKVSHSLIAVGAVGVRVPLYLGHS